MLGQRGQRLLGVSSPIPFWEHARLPSPWKNVWNSYGLAIIRAAGILPPLAVMTLDAPFVVGNYVGIPYDFCCNRWFR